MKKIIGIPMIEIILKRLKKVKQADEIIVATSKNKENKVLIEHLKKIKTNYFCGDENDVLERFYKISECEKGNLNISDLLKYSVSCIPFERLN